MNPLDDVEPPVHVENENNTEQGDNSKKKPRKLHSDVWKDFSIFGEPDQEGKEDIRCNHCEQKYFYNLHRNGTSCLKRHMLVCKGRRKDGNVGSLIVDYEGKLKARKIDQMAFREMIAMAIIEHDLPYSFVENKRIRMAFHMANPDIKFWSRNTAASDVYKFFEKEKKRLIMTLTEIPSRVCLTTDLWRAITVEGYLCLTAHYIDSDWKLNNKILSFCAFPPPHSGVHIAMKLHELLKEWGLEKKIFSLTVDNASANDTMQDILKRKLQKDLLCNGEFFHIRCSAHILNLIVQDGLAMIDDALEKVRKSIKYVKGSETRIIMYQSCVETVGLQVRAGLDLDVKTRWNSTYNMLDRAIKHRKALAHLNEIDRGYTDFPSDLEWTRGELIRELLKPFDEITNLISGSTYPTSNLYFMKIWNIECWLQLNQNSEDELIKDMVRVMKLKFEKYWKEYSNILAIAAVLDPRMKLSVLEFWFTKLDPLTFQQKVDHVRFKMYMLFNSYKGTSESVESATSSQTHVAMFDDNAPQGYNEFYTFCSQKNVDHGKTPLDVYLDEMPLDMIAHKDMNILEYWKENATHFKELSVMAADVLSLPITTVASESSFSIGSRVLNKYRSRLLPSNVQALLSARNWLRGFEENDEDFEDFCERAHEVGA